MSAHVTAAHGAAHRADDHEDSHGTDAHSYAIHLRHSRLGLWLFFISEIFLFGALLAARFYLWRDDHGAIVRPELDQVVGLIVTGVLLLSSWSMNMAETAMEYDDRRTFSIGMISTFILGSIFLFGVMIFEWGLIPFPGYTAHLKPWDGAFGAVVFGMTGIHALHVLSGLVFIAIVWRMGRQGHYSGEQHWGVEACAIYWHYVDLVWIFFYPAIYLIGHVLHH